MISKLKQKFLARAIFMAAGLIFSGSALADPVCETLEDCQTLRAYLQSQLIQVDARIDELLGSEKRTTTTGAVFTRDRSNPALGDEAWRDPDGLIWGDIVKNEDGLVRYMVQSSEYMKKIGIPLPEGQLGAKEYCESIGARLPSKEEFIRLREYMGARSGTDEGYSHHDNKILPNLSGDWFWSSSVSPSYAYGAYYFYGRDGNIYDGNRSSLTSAVRCVVGR